MSGQQITLDCIVNPGRARSFFMRWYWAVYNPRPFIPHPNFVKNGRTLTMWGARWAAHRAAASEMRRYGRYWRRNRYATSTFKIVDWFNSQRLGERICGTLR